MDKFLGGFALPGRSLGTPHRRPTHGGRLTPYAVCRLGEQPETENGWTMAKVAAMSTDDIVKRLIRCGVKHSTLRYRLLAAEVHSAWQVSDMWVAQDKVRSEGPDRAFLGLAAVELWKRTIPDRPCNEVLDDWIQEGYGHVQAGRTVAACQGWWNVWSVVRPRLTPDMTTVTRTETVFLGTQPLSQWAGDFMVALQAAAEQELRWADIGTRFCGELQQQFRDETEPLLVCFRQGLGCFLILAGAEEEGRAIFRGMIVQWPQNPAPYLALG
ncbi:MAG TPA: hypothetical protein VGO93_27085, partial [Candidatus Xenobia bacterium]